jgi:hypothetical protein
MFKEEESGVRIGRRDALSAIAAMALVGSVEPAAAQHVHQAAAAETKAAGVFRPKALTAHEFETLKVLCEMIIPGASRGGAAEFVDLLAGQNAELLSIYTGGLGWLDRTMKKQYGDEFLTAKAAERTAMLDKIAYRRNETPELSPGIRFFNWARRLTVDAYYTSAAGIKELGYMGNKGQAEFKVPASAVEYALKRSGLG